LGLFKRLFGLFKRLAKIFKREKRDARAQFLQTEGGCFAKISKRSGAFPLKFLCFRAFESMKAARFR